MSLNIWTPLLIFGKMTPILCLVFFLILIKFILSLLAGPDVKDTKDLSEMSVDDNKKKPEGLCDLEKSKPKDKNGRLYKNIFFRF